MRKMAAAVVKAIVQKAGQDGTFKRYQEYRQRKQEEAAAAGRPPRAATPQTPPPSTPPPPPLWDR